MAAIKLTRKRQPVVETPMEMILEAHYAKVFFKNEWTYPRVRRLCELLQLTERELARLVGAYPGHFQSYIKKDRIPRPVQILLELLERYYRKLIYGDIPEGDLFPNLDNRP